MEYDGGSDRRKNQDRSHEKASGTPLEMNGHAVLILPSCEGESTVSLRNLGMALETPSQRSVLLARRRFTLLMNDAKVGALTFSSNFFHHLIRTLRGKRLAGTRH